MTTEYIYWTHDNKEEIESIHDAGFKAGYKNGIDVFDGDKCIASVVMTKYKEDQFINCEYTNPDCDKMCNVQFTEWEKGYMNGLERAEIEFREQEEKEEEKQENCSVLFN